MKDLSDETLAFGERVMTALLGLDAVYREESGDGFGLAVLNMDVEGRYSADDFGGYADAREAFGELQADATALPEADRRVYYDQLCHSTLAFITWRTDGLSFEDRLRDFLHGSVRPVGDAELDQLRGALGARLREAGYEGSLREMSAAWERANQVPAEEVPAVANAYLDEAWDATERLLLPIPAEKSDGMRFASVAGVPYNARCDYLRRTVQLNVDAVLTKPGLRHLAVHEGYPGHFVQFRMRETMARAGEAPADVLLSIVNSASSSVFEGIADGGMEMIGWDQTPDDRIQGLMTRYRAGIGTGAAWRLHAEGWSVERATDWLREASLIGGDGWVESRVAFISAPERAVLIWSYWWGEPSVIQVWRRVPAERRPDFLRFLLGRMHSASSLRLFH